YISVSRLARAKHIDILVKTANSMKFNLKIVGSGRDETYLRSIAGPTVEFLTGLSDEELKNVYHNAKAFLFASVDEEFGIAPVEAMRYGVPVIAYSSGGLKETVVDEVNGYLYSELKEESLIEKIKKLESLSEKEYGQMRKNARKEAEKYSEEVFKKKMEEFVKEKLGMLSVKS
ncbi:MAG: glycosyltransferase, partial [bacterium]|nr:glycosyltransferase [bacterium]